MQDYPSLFQEALNQSKKLNINVDMPLPFGEKRYVNEWLMYELGPKIGEMFTQENFVKLMRQPNGATQLHLRFLPIVDALLGVESLLTFGYIQVPNDEDIIETFGIDQIESYKTAIQTQATPQKLHSWLTLPSGEVIDLAFMTIYGLLYNEPSLFGNLVAKMPSEFTGGMRYVPLVVGRAFLDYITFSEPLTTE